MKAMILAAGIGSRLGQHTEEKPKALVEIKGITLLEIVLRRLQAVGIKDVVINVHHFPEQIRTFLERKSNFGINIEISFEPKLLDTGGGLKKVAPFFGDGEPFLLHNVDIISNIDLPAMVNAHSDNNNLVTLAVQQGVTRRYLVFDEEGLLCGWKSYEEKKQKMARPPKGQMTEFGFCGIHVISPAFLDKLEEKAPFSIIDAYLRLTGEGERISAFDINRATWFDAGKKEVLKMFNAEQSPAEN